MDSNKASGSGYQPRYNSEEKAWLKDNYGGEYHFLHAHGLKMHNDDDRQEGKAIVQGFIEQDRAQGQGQAKQGGK